MVAKCAPAVNNEQAAGLVVASDPSSWAISPIEHGEVDAIAVFYAGFEGEKRPLEFWRERLRLWWAGNPAFHEHWHRGVKTTAGGRIVGVLAAIPLRIRNGGQDTVGAALTTWRVEKSHRAASMGMFEAVLQAHAGRPVFNGTPTQGVVRLLIHYGFHQPRAHFHATRFLCNGWSLLVRACGRKSATLPASIFFVNDRRSSLEEVALLVDDLWARHQPEFDNMCIKDGAYFRWYCHPGRTNGRFGIVATDSAGHAQGMAICLDMGSGVAWLVDMWCDFSSPEAVARLVVQARGHATRLGFHCLWVPHFHPAVASVCGTRERVRELPVSAFFRIPATAGEAPTSYWTLALGDFGI